jgi:hypothetical protein
MVILCWSRDSGVRGRCGEAEEFADLVPVQILVMGLGDGVKQ